MHWEAHEFAMPKLPRGLKWELLLETDAAGEGVSGKEGSAGEGVSGKEGSVEESASGKDSTCKEGAAGKGDASVRYGAAGEEQEQRNMSLVPPRTVAVFISRGTQEQK